MVTNVSQLLMGILIEALKMSGLYPHTHTQIDKETLKKKQQDRH